MLCNELWGTHSNHSMACEETEALRGGELCLWVIPQPQQAYLLADSLSFLCSLLLGNYGGS
jgi:hypothetical protein